uniref:Uncharacterized protein n=1 Tax=Meloidogyne incognita TaxID=6306 RepID=A0A914M6N8_MELIC
MGPGGTSTHPGEDSGSKHTSEELFTQLCANISPLLEDVGNAAQCENLEYQKLIRHAQPFTAPAPKINNVREQYVYLVHQYEDLLKESAKLNEELRVGYTTRNQYLQHPGFSQEIHRVMINSLKTPIENNKRKQNGLLADMQKLYDYVLESYNFVNQAILNEDVGTSGHDQQEQGQYGQGHHVQAQYVHGHRGQDRRGQEQHRRSRIGEHRGSGPDN